MPQAGDSMVHFTVFGLTSQELAALNTIIFVLLLKLNPSVSPLPHNYLVKHVDTDGLIKPLLSLFTSIWKTQERSSVV